MSQSEDMKHEIEGRRGGNTTYDVSSKENVLLNPVTLSSAKKMALIGSVVGLRAILEGECPYARIMVIALDSLSQQVAAKCYATHQSTAYE